MSEVWKPLPGLSEYYEVSNTGKVRKLAYEITVIRQGKEVIRRYPEKELRQYTNDRGYKVVGLYTAELGQVTVGVHRLVCITFNGPPPTVFATHVCHRNGIRTDNRPENLYWGTPKDNGLDRQFHSNYQHGHARPEDWSSFPDAVREWWRENQGSFREVWSGLPLEERRRVCWEAGVSTSYATSLEKTQAPAPWIVSAIAEVIGFEITPFEEVTD